MLLNPSLKPRSTYSLGHRTFRRKVDLFIDSEEFILKTAESLEELSSALELRTDFRSQKYGAPLEHAGRPDPHIDPFDQICDHLIIYHKLTGATVGTYRLLSSEFSDSFYYQQQFILQSLLDFPGIKLELSRAYIDPSFLGRQTVTSLLWEGVSQYARKIRADLLFGCTTVKTNHSADAAAIYYFLNETWHISDKFITLPALKYRVHGFDSALRKLESTSGPDEAFLKAKIISPLLISYLRAGGKVCGEPALDLTFKFIEFLTAVETREMSGFFEDGLPLLF